MTKSGKSPEGSNHLETGASRVLWNELEMGTFAIPEMRIFIIFLMRFHKSWDLSQT